MTDSDNYIELVAAGPRTTVQDSGRRGAQRYGVSVSGMLDSDAAVLGNRLVGNDSRCAVLECTFGSVDLRFDSDAVVAITGARAEVGISGIPQPMWTTLLVPSGANLELGIPTEGSHVYVAVRGGIDVPEVLGSRSTHLGTKMGGLEGRTLTAGDRLPIGISSNAERAPLAGTTVPDGFDASYLASSAPIRAVPGAQYEVFGASVQTIFWESVFTVSAVSDRQGARLEGPQVSASDMRHDIVSEAAYFGAVQVPSDGQPIVLLADRQTTGGYAKIASVISADLGRMAQLSPGSEVRFEEVDVSEAQELGRTARRIVHDTPLREPAGAETVSLICNSVSYDVAVRHAGTGAGASSLWWAQVGDGEESAVAVS